MNDIEREMEETLTAATFGRPLEPTAAEMAARFVRDDLKAMAEDRDPSYDYHGPRPPRSKRAADLNRAINHYKGAPVDPVVGVEHDVDEVITDKLYDALAERERAAALPPLGVKHDAGKAPVWQGVFANFPNALLQVAHVSHYGQTKYPSFQDWQQVPDALNRYRNGLGRHMLEIAAGEQFDAESKLLHAAHAAWNALVVLEIQLREATRAK